MKKLMKTLALCLCLLLALSACGSSSYISFDDVYTDLTTEIDFGDNMAEMSEIAAENFYFIYDTDVMEDFVIYMDESNSTPNEIALFRLAEESDRTTVETIVKNRINDLKIGFEDYDPDEMYKLENAVVKAQGKFVMMVICGDNAKAAEIINGYLK